MNRSEAAKIAAMLMGLYPNHKLGPDSEAGYAMALADAPYATVTALMPQIMDAHPTFCPGPAELRAFVKSITNPEPSWELGWEAMMSQVKSVGSWGQPRFDDPATAETVRILGWFACCAVPDPRFGGDTRERGMFQNRFREVYQWAVAHQQREAAVAALPEPTRIPLDRSAS